MPTASEYRVGATAFRDWAELLEGIPTAPDGSLPATELEGPFRRFFGERLGECRWQTQQVADQLRALADHCWWRATVCEEYHDRIAAHYRNPAEVEWPTKRYGWVE